MHARARPKLGRRGPAAGTGWTRAGPSAGLDTREDSAPPGRAPERGDLLHHALGRELVHALEMPERTLARKARAAFDPGPDDASAARERRRMLMAGRAVQRHHRAPEAGRDVHESRVVAHHDFGEGKQVDRARKVGPAAQIDGGAFAG